MNTDRGGKQKHTDNPTELDMGDLGRMFPPVEDSKLKEIVKGFDVLFDRFETEKIKKADEIVKSEQSLPEPRAGEIWRHRKTGERYMILIVGCENAGKLREIESSGQVHVYVNMRTNKVYARLTHYWEKEMESFELVFPQTNGMDFNLYRQGTWINFCVGGDGRSNFTGNK